MHSQEYLIKVYADHIKKENFTLEYLKLHQHSYLTPCQLIAVQNRIKELESENNPRYKEHINKALWLLIGAIITAIVKISFDHYFVSLKNQDHKETQGTKIKSQQNLTNEH